MNHDNLLKEIPDFAEPSLENCTHRKQFRLVVLGPFSDDREEYRLEEKRDLVYISRSPLRV